MVAETRYNTSKPTPTQAQYDSRVNVVVDSMRLLIAANRGRGLLHGLLYGRLLYSTAAEPTARQRDRVLCYVHHGQPMSPQRCSGQLAIP
jgi:hypothetical protein